jgi:hypothetical protein
VIKIKKKTIIMADKSGKKSRKAITLDTKIKIIKLNEDGFSKCEISLTTKILSEVIRHFEMGMALLEKHDRDFERSSKVNSGIVKQYACYTEIYTEKKRQSSMQTSLDRYFKK